MSFLKIINYCRLDMSDAVFLSFLPLLLSGCGGGGSGDGSSSTTSNTEQAETKLVIFLPGGGFISQPDNCELTANVQGLPEKLAEHGWSFEQMCYPVAPPYTYPLSKDFIKSEVSSLRHRFDKIVLLGSSAGANIAVLASLELDSSQLSAVIGYYGIYDIPSLPANVKSSYTDIYTDDSVAASPSSYGIPQMPMLLFHGDEDSLVPFEQSTNYCSQCTVIMNGKGHSFPIVETWPILKDLLSEL